MRFSEEQSSFAKHARFARAAAVTLKAFGVIAIAAGVVVGFYIRMQGHNVPDHNGGHSLFSYLARNAAMFLGIVIGLPFWYYGNKIEKRTKCRQGEELYGGDGAACNENEPHDSDRVSSSVFANEPEESPDIPSLSKAEVEESPSRSRQAR